MGPIRPSLRWCFWCCGSVLGPEVAEVCQTKATCKTQQAIWNLEAGSAERLVKARFVASFLGVQKATFWHSGLPAAGPIRPSLPWCFGAAQASLDSRWPRCARRKPPAFGRRNASIYAVFCPWQYQTPANYTIFCTLWTDFLPWWMQKTLVFTCFSKNRRSWRERNPVNNSVLSTFGD